ncbi:hypothetical protein ABFA25_02855 [Mycobacterium lepromatosis]|uniref:hypothetical protein n=1 Tax=Mycobacterium lepromatosis TaxID=480418 RepID=UPI0012E05777
MSFSAGLGLVRPKVLAQSRISVSRRCAAAGELPAGLLDYGGRGRRSTAISFRWFSAAMRIGCVHHLVIGRIHAYTCCLTPSLVVG